MYTAEWINFKNGYYDPVEQVMYPHDPKYLCLNQIPHEFHPEQEDVLLTGGEVTKAYAVEDCKIYEEMTPEEKEEHRQNKEEHGVESFEFKRRKNAELDQQIVEKEAVLSHKQKAQPRRQRSDKGRNSLKRRESVSAGSRII